MWTGLHAYRGAWRNAELFIRLGKTGLDMFNGIL